MRNSSLHGSLLLNVCRFLRDLGGNVAANCNEGNMTSSLRPGSILSNHVEDVIDVISTTVTIPDNMGATWPFSHHAWSPQEQATILQSRPQFIESSQ